MLEEGVSVEIEPANMLADRLSSSSLQDKKNIAAGNGSIRRQTMRYAAYSWS